MAEIQRGHVCRIERWKLGVDRRSLASLESQSIRKMRKVVLIREFQEDPPGLGTGSLEQLRKQEAPSFLGMIPSVRGIDLFVNLIVLRPDEGVGVSDKLSEEASALSRILDVERDVGGCVKARLNGEQRYARAAITGEDDDSERGVSV